MRSLATIGLTENRVVGTIVVGSMDYPGKRVFILWSEPDCRPKPFRLMRNIWLISSPANY